MTTDLSGGVGIIAYLWWRKNRWIKVGRVEDLFIYPLKGGKIVPLEEMYCGFMGPQTDHILDRGFMIGKKDVGLIILIS
mgnify:CR=1 FL=1